MKPCPYCTSQVQDAASKCGYCGMLLTPDELAKSPPQTRPVPLGHAAAQGGSTSGEPHLKGGGDANSASIADVASREASSDVIKPVEKRIDRSQWTRYWLLAVLVICGVAIGIVVGARKRNVSSADGDGPEKHRPLMLGWSEDQFIKVWGQPSWSDNNDHMCLKPDSKCKTLRDATFVVLGWGPENFYPNLGIPKHMAARFHQHRAIWYMVVPRQGGRDGVADLPSIKDLLGWTPPSTPDVTRPASGNWVKTKRRIWHLDGATISVFSISEWEADVFDSNRGASVRKTVSTAENESHVEKMIISDPSIFSD